MSAMADGTMDGEIELVPTGPPRTLKATFWATVVWSVISILAVLTLYTERPYLRKTLVTSNNKAKKPIANYTGHVLDDAVQKSLTIGLVVTLLVVVILILLAQLVWRGRPWARWGLIAMATVPGVFFGVGIVGQLAFGTLQSSPGLHKLLTILAGFASLLVVVLLVQSDTRTYFAAVRDTKRGTLPAVPASARDARGGRGSSRRPSTASAPQAGTGAASTSASNSAWAPRSGGLGALFRKAIPTAPSSNQVSSNQVSSNQVSSNDVSTNDGSSSDAAMAGSTDTAAESADRPAAAPARRASATRPGSVKAKGSGTRPGRSKSRQQ